jgi:hypothetical protein
MSLTAAAMATHTAVRTIRAARGSGADLALAAVAALALAAEVSKIVSSRKA